MADESEYTIEFRIVAATWYHECDKSLAGLRNLKKRLKERFDGIPPDTRVIQTWEEKLFRSGSILDQKRSGRPSARGDEIETVRHSVADNPTQSVRRRSDELRIPSTTLYRVMTKDLGLKSWRPTKVQFLSEEDRQNRVAICQQILAKYDNPVRRNKLFFTDECAFYAEGSGRLQISFWSKENPFFWEQIRQHPPTVMAWVAMSARHIIGPFFLTGGITGEKYRQMLQEEFIPAIEERGIVNSAHFQQDGAPAHTAHETRNFLNNMFPDRWVGKFGPVSWPPRSPDLSSCDNALWGILKPRVIAQRPTNVEQLKEAITEKIQEIPQDLLQAINARTFRRMSLCIEHNGVQTDPYDI